MRDCFFPQYAPDARSILRTNRKKMFNSLLEISIEDRTQAGSQQQRGYRSRTPDFGKDSVHV
jgi:hypothetical protein